MTRKQLDGARELRLWIRDLVIPAAGVGLTLYANPATHDWCKQKVDKVKNKFHKNKYTVVK